MEETDRKRREDRQGETKQPDQGQRRSKPQPEKVKKDQDRQKRV